MTRMRQANDELHSLLKMRSSLLARSTAPGPTTALCQLVSFTGQVHGRTLVMQPCIEVIGIFFSHIVASYYYCCCLLLPSLEGRRRRIMEMGVLFSCLVVWFRIQSKGVNEHWNLVHFKSRNSLDGGIQ